MSEKCAVCPRRCQAARPFSAAGAVELPGVCRCPYNAVVSGIGLHHWEEPVISGDRGSGTVFFAGCNLHCVFCQNHAISSGCSGKEFTAGSLRELYLELTGKGAHNINLVTPGHFVPVIAESLNDPLPVPVVYNSNGYELPETLRMMENKADIYLPDLKYIDNSLALRYSQAKDYFEVAAAAIDEMYRQTGDFIIGDDGLMKRGVIIRHLILPGALENTLRIIEYVAKKYRPGQVMFSLMHQYLPCGLVSEENYPELNRRITDFEYETAEAALFASGIEDGFVQDSDSAVKDYIPPFMVSFSSKESDNVQIL
ncbi:MAG: 4Fe-4S cluster-binding domain-containing protein [Lentisphaerae bacterium]|nr:4Fe-4S cluster-binding domain-containing protein [Lentisphaerota bacterium]